MTDCVAHHPRSSSRSHHYRCPTCSSCNLDHRYHVRYRAAAEEQHLLYLPEPCQHRWKDQCHLLRQNRYSHRRGSRRLGCEDHRQARQAIFRTALGRRRCFHPRWHERKDTSTLRTRYLSCPATHQWGDCWRSIGYQDVRVHRLDIGRRTIPSCHRERRIRRRATTSTCANRCQTPWYR